MKQLMRLMIFSVLIFMLSACDSKPVEKTVWDDQVKAMDDARQVEDKLNKRAEDLAKQLDGETADKDEDNPPQ